MSSIIQGLNKAFENRVRLGIMSILMVNQNVDFTTLKEMLQVSDGNLSSHISALEKVSYVSIKKRFIGNKPNTSYSVTARGKKAFMNHLNAIEKLIKNGGKQ